MQKPYHWHRRLLRARGERPRGRARTDHGMLHLMGAAAKTLDSMCCKIYTTTHAAVRFQTLLYDGKTGEFGVDGMG